MHIETSDANDPAIRKAILDPLIVYNDEQTGTKTVAEELALAIRDTGGAVIGGLIGVSYWDWLHVDLLALPASHRGQRLGSRLMQEAENVAVRRGCRGVWLDTASFQARPFYEKLGYTVFGTIDDYPPPHRRHFLTKTPLAARPVDLAGIEVSEEPAEDVRPGILACLRRFNEEASGPADFTYWAIVVRDDAGAIEGGMWTRSGRGWMFVELFHLPAHARRQGLGTELMDMAEDHARSIGCRGLWLDTSSFQARPFYEKRGFTVYGQIDDHPPGHTRYFLQKRLDR
jgi:GNAT superfamily N-acetyltransferase